MWKCGIDYWTVVVEMVQIIIFDLINQLVERRLVDILVGGIFCVKLN